MQQVENEAEIKNWNEKTCSTCAPLGILLASFCLQLQPLRVWAYV